MDVAVGRLQFSIRVADTRKMTVDAPTEPRVDAVEAAFRREQSRRELAAERERWAATTPHHQSLIR